MGSSILKSKKTARMNSNVLKLAVLISGMVLLCNIESATGQRLCSNNWYYTNYDCRANCHVCQYPCQKWDSNCGADYDDDDQVGEGGRGVDGQTRPNSGSEDTNDYSYGYDG